MRIRTVKDLRWHVGAHDLDVETSRGADCVPDIGKAIWAMPDATLADVVSAVKAMHKDMLHIAGLPLETPND